MPTDALNLGPYHTPPSSEDRLIMTAITEGQPEKIIGLNWDKPDFSAKGHKIVRGFAIDRKKRPSRDHIRCAICSGNHPKFLDGAVVWSPDRWLRLIGHVCAAKPEHFGVAGYDKMRAARKLEDLTSAAEEWVYANIKNLQMAKADLDYLIKILLCLENVQKDLFRKVPTLANYIDNMVRRQSSTLTIDEILSGDRLLAAREQFGHSVSQYQTTTLGVMKGGQLFTRPRPSRVRQLSSNKEALSRVPDGDVDDSMLSMIDRGDAEFNIAAGLSLRAIQRTITVANDYIEAVRFVDEENLALMTEWGGRANCPVPFSMRRSKSQVTIVLEDKSRVNIPTDWSRMIDLTMLNNLAQNGLELSNSFK